VLRKKQRNKRHKSVDDICVDYLSPPYSSKLIIYFEFCVYVCVCVCVCVPLSLNAPYIIILKCPDYFILLLTLECFKMTAWKLYVLDSWVRISGRGRDFYFPITFRASLEIDPASIQLKPKDYSLGGRLPSSAQVSSLKSTAPYFLWWYCYKNKQASNFILNHA
jgi:hypothetical protein